MKLTGKIAPRILTIALLLASCYGGPSNPDIRIGKAIPSFELAALDGGEISSESYLGKPVVLNFWATWCHPCLKEIPTLKAIDKDSPAEVVTIAIDVEGEDIVRPFVEKHGIDYTVLIGDAGVIQRYNGTGIPYTLVLDSALRIVNVHHGYVSLRSIERDLRRAAS